MLDLMCGSTYDSAIKLCGVVGHDFKDGSYILCPILGFNIVVCFMVAIPVVKLSVSWDLAIDSSYLHAIASEV